MKGFENQIRESNNERLFVVSVGDKCGFINREGTLVINPQFDEAAMTAALIDNLPKQNKLLSLKKNLRQWQQC